MVYSGWFLSEAPEVWPDTVVEKGFLVGRTKRLEGGKTKFMCIYIYIYIHKYINIFDWTTDVYCCNSR